ncbi:MAG: hypothetical protein HYY84_19990 [Deltaproteobacteria bacterium]|nr:hypothetical protein [Deltaproteobacteria bacterium]
MGSLRSTRRAVVLVVIANAACLRTPLHLWLPDAGVADGGADADAGADAGKDAGDASESVIDGGDKTPPYSIINAIVGPAPVDAGIFISGYCSDPVTNDPTAGVLYVEYSVDNGATWTLATGTNSWSGSFTASRFEHRILSRGTDDAGNVEIPDGGQRLFVMGVPSTDILGRGADAGSMSTCVNVVGATGLWGPEGVAVGSQPGRLFIADTHNHRVVVHSLSAGHAVDAPAEFVLGQSSFDSCDPGLSATQMNYPARIAIDSIGRRLFVSDTWNNRVLVFDLDAVSSGLAATTVLGQTVFTLGLASTSAWGLNQPAGLAVDIPARILYIADYGNNRVVAYNLDGGLSNGQAAVGLIGQPDFLSSGSGRSANKLSGPSGVTVDGDAGRLYVADTWNNRVLVFQTPIGVGLANATGVLGQDDMDAGVAAATSVGMRAPRGVRYMPGTSKQLAVADTDNHRVLFFVVDDVTSGAPAVAVLGQSDFLDASAGLGASRLSAPRDVAFLSQYQLLWVADTGNNRALEFDVSTISNGEVATSLLGHVDTDGGGTSYLSSCVGEPLGAATSFTTGVAVDSVRYRLFVSDVINNRILVYSLDGQSRAISRNAFAVIGQPGFTTCAPGTSQAGLNQPAGLALSFDGGRLWVADFSNNRALEFNIEGSLSGLTATNIIGQNGSYTTSICQTTEGGLCGPRAILVDNVNRIFVADSYNNRVMVYPGGVVVPPAINVIGQTDFNSRIDAGGATGLVEPAGLAFRPGSNHLFVSSRGENRVMVFDVTSLSTGQAASFVLGAPGFSTSAGTTTDESILSQPRGLAWSAAENLLFVADTGFNRVIVYDVSQLDNGEAAVNVLGQVSMSARDGGTSASSMNEPFDVAIDSSGRQLYVADHGNKRVVRIEVGR